MPLEGSYSFDDVGSSTVLDLSGNSQHITLPAGSAQVAGINTGALGKTVTGTVSLPAALRTATETDDRTFMCRVLGLRSVWWVRYESVSLNTGVVGMLSLDAANLIARARDQGNNGPSPSNPAIGALSGSVDHHAAFRYVKSTGVLTTFWDGLPVTTANLPPGTALYVGADDLNVAEWGSSGPAIDDLRFFSHALTDSEVFDLHNVPVSSSAVEAELALALSRPTLGLTVASMAPATLALALGGPSLALTATAVDTVAANLALARPAVDLQATAQIAASLVLGLRGPTLALTDTQTMATTWPPAVGPGDSYPPILVGTPETVPRLLVGPPVPD